MKPSIGRIVHYTTAMPRDKVRTLAAMIIAVNQDGSVALKMFDPQDHIHAKERVAFSDTPEVGHWSWPPREP